ncbi:MAG TPA: hypothetical protein VJ044_01085, partial [Candidatus Hodarchaeales archaeon]|nr:hypothetical protein [Candidatus Hodarchaeales archaeon]
TLKPMERMLRLTQARYNNVSQNLCGTCITVLCEGFLNFLAKTNESAEQLGSLKEVSLKERQLLTKAKGAEETPADRKISPSTEMETPRTDLPSEPGRKLRPNEVSQDQKNRIKRIMDEINVREPVEDEMYLEIRERFLKGKVSEHLFKQQAKRLSRAK